jgi:hypothetical protein
MGGMNGLFIPGRAASVCGRLEGRGVPAAYWPSKGLVTESAAGGAVRSAAWIAAASVGMGGTGGGLPSSG